ncbi:anti-sigma factor family protein [Embleya sp. AB8]|uniref:anti-sigma factor family protein n=1 Tax=Embleya sp. AB8 TaxID=3156304 RepID=UPI003C729D03
MSEHIDVEVLSDLVEGLLTAEEAAALDAHLAECAECRDTRDALAEVRELLGGQPAEPMPADVIARIDDALAPAALPPPRPAEPPVWLPAAPIPAGPTAPAPVPAARPAPATEHLVVPLDRERRRLRRGPLLLAAAAVAAVALGVTVLVGTGDDEKSGGKSVAGADRKSDASAPQAAAPTGQVGERPGQNAEEQTPSTPAKPSGVAPKIYTRDGLTEQIDRLLRSGRAPAALPGCVAGAVGPDAVHALATDTGSYAGAPAWVVVLPGPNAGRVRVDIVDASCVQRSAADTSGGSTGTSSVPPAGPSTLPATPLAGSVLLRTEVPRR